MNNAKKTLVPLEQITTRKVTIADHAPSALLVLKEIVVLNTAVLFSRKTTPNTDGQEEVHNGVKMTHRFVDAPADGDLIKWHYVEAGSPRQDRPTLVFLHGMPESWYMWNHQMAAFASQWHCIAPDLRGYGQSDKSSGDYRQEGVADQIHALLQKIGVTSAVFITHDRGSVIADYLIANHSDIAAGYVRGEQHLVHFHPSLAPQEQFFLDPKASRKLTWTWLAIPITFASLTQKTIALKDRIRTWQEWRNPEIGSTVLRYFYASSFLKEWRDRRMRLIKRWNCPILILQGEHDVRQPKSNYLGIEPYFHDARVEFIDAGHFFVTENPTATTRSIAAFLDEKVLTDWAV